MQTPELLEEIRALLRQPQRAMLDTPITYQDEDLIVQVRSTMRYLRAIGVTALTQTMDPAGVLSADLNDTIGLVIAFSVAAALLSGDMIKKLNAGEAGLYWKSGSDVIDTRDVGAVFEQKAAQYKHAYQSLLTIVLTNQIGGTEDVFGLQEPFGG